MTRTDLPLADGVDLTGTLGELVVSVPSQAIDSLRAWLVDDGYLYLPQFWECETVLAVRRGLVERLKARGTSSSWDAAEPES